MSELVHVAAYQVLPPMPAEQFAALKADIAERGVLVPIDVDEHGSILDGHHRHRACLELGVSDFPTIVRPGLSEDERRAFARKNNMLRRHLTRAQIRDLIAAQLKETPNWANNRIGGALGVDSKTVASARAELEATSEIPRFDRLVGADGKERPVKRPAILASGADELQRVIDNLKKGGDGNLSGFFSEGQFTAAFVTFYSPEYNMFAGRSDAEIAEWKRFADFILDGSDDEKSIGGVWRHIEWLLQRPFQNVSEWLGPDGQGWRTRCRMPEPSDTFKRAWDKHNIAALDDRAVPI